MGSIQQFLQTRLAGFARAAETVLLLTCFAAVLAVRPITAQTAEPAADAQDNSSDNNRSIPAHAPPFVPLTGSQKLHRYLETYSSPRTPLMAAAGAAIAQASDSVPEWGQGTEGYAKRFGNAYGKNAVNSSIRFGFDALMGYDPRYWPSESTGFGKRTADAVSQMFRTRDDAGRWRIAYPTFASNFGTGLISRTWNPHGHRSVADALKSGAISFGAEAALLVIKEFVRFAR